MRKIANDIALTSTVSQGDTMAVIESLLQNIPRYLAEGKIVRLGELGRFYLSIQAEGSSDAKSVITSKIKRKSFKLFTMVIYLTHHGSYDKLPRLERG